MALTLAPGSTLEKVLGGALSDTLKGNASANYLSGGGLNGAYKLTRTTIGNDSAVDSLFGEGGDDWFLASANDTTDADPLRETVTPI